MADYNKKVSVGRVYRLMKSMALPKMSTVKPKTNYKKDGDDNLKNLLNKDFNPKAPNQVWVSDITYVKASGRFCYVCAIMDLYSRKILAYKSSTKIDTRLVIDTFNLAYSRRGCPKGVMFHTDQGTQYTAKDFRMVIDKADFVHSFSAKGHPYDNAVMESFFKYLKHEELDRRIFNSIQELNLSLFEYVEGFYNKNRPHSANDYLSPNEKETVFWHH
jgi:transposase InsO family protein